MSPKRLARLVAAVLVAASPVAAAATVVSVASSADAASHAPTSVIDVITPDRAHGSGPGSVNTGCLVA